MINKTILTKILKKGGIEFSSLYYEIMELEGKPLSRYTLNGVFFSHPFLKAFFGERSEQIPPHKSIEDVDKECPVCKHETCNRRYNPTENKGWQYHAQQLVLSEDPIQYLKEHL